MNRSIKSPEVITEKTVSHKKFLSDVCQIKPKTLDLTSGSQLRLKKQPNSSVRIKKIQIRIGSNSFIADSEIVGEEGTAQHIRSPIVKRGKSSSHSIDLTNPTFPASPHQVQSREQLSTLLLENTSLKQQLNFFKDQVKIYQSSISDLSSKYESSKTETLELEEKVTKILIENRKLTEENEKLFSMLKFLENDHGSLNRKSCLQEALEAKILSIDQDREEKAEQYKRILSKYIGVLQEYANSEEWVLGLVHSPYPKKELLENEEQIKSRLDRLQVEVIYYQSQLNNEKFIEKSYCTSIETSVFHSPMYSPTKTLRFTNFQDLLSPTQKESLI